MRTPLIAAAGVAGAWTAAHLTAPAVRSWDRPERRPADVSGLHVDVAGPDRPGPVFVLLHGIIASGISWGAAWDALPGPVVVPDLLGFGRSMHRPTDGYDRADHLAALAPVLPALGLAGRPVVVVGHSLGGVLALHLAASLPDVAGVVAICAPLYGSEEEGLGRIGEADALAKLLAVGDLSQRICEWMCDHRDLAGVLWPLMAPRWPLPISADGVLHTWPAYIGSLRSLVLESAWEEALGALVSRDVPVHLVEGADDGVPVPGRAAGLEAAHPAVTSEVVGGAGHDLPVSRPAPCTDRVAGLARRWTA